MERAAPALLSALKALLACPSLLLCADTKVAAGRAAVVEAEGD